MNKLLINEIKKHIDQYEQQFDIHILFWAIRSSINIGIKRRNSDLDILFVYKSQNVRQCFAIHDMAGHGLDFWGIEIHEILTTILKNNELAYQQNGCPGSWYISPQHKRAGCNYYFGIYSTIGNQYYQDRYKFIINTSPFFMEMFEKKIAAQQMVDATKAAIDNIRYYEKTYLYDYLYAIWRLELCRHIISGGVPGENNIYTLMDKYCSGEIKKQVQYYLNLYKTTYRKRSAFFQIESFNKFIMNEFCMVQQLIDTAKYEKERTCFDAYKKITEIIKML